QQERPVADGVAKGELVDADPEADQEAAEEAERSEAAEEVHRADGVAGEEDDGDEVEEAPDEALQPELCGAVLARVVLHGLLADAAVALPLRQQRDVAVQLAVDAHALDDLAAVQLDAGVEVVERDAADLARDHV